MMRTLMAQAQRLLLLLSALQFLSSTTLAQDLVWSEEFRSTGSLDPNVWSYDVGSGGWGNGEMQEYKEENVEVKDGKLVITVNEQDSQWSGRTFTSGRIRSNEKLEFQYGTVEAKIQVPDPGRGLWPALWMLGKTYPETAWPMSGEIDIMELGSARALGLNQATTRVGSAVHWEAFGRNQYDYNEVTTDFDMTDDFHIYKLEWTPDEIVTWVDDVRILEKSISPDECYECEELHQPYFFVVNVAVGGGFPRIYHQAGITADLPTEMVVDYIRIYDNGFTRLNGTSLMMETPSPTESPSNLPSEMPTGVPAMASTGTPSSTPVDVPTASLTTTPLTSGPTGSFFPTGGNRGDEPSPTEAPSGAPTIENKTPTNFEPTAGLPTQKQPPSPTIPQVVSNLPIQHLEAEGIRMTLTNVEPFDPRTEDMWAEVTRDFLVTQTTTSIGPNLVDSVDVSASLVSQNPPFSGRKLRALQEATAHDLSFDASFDIQSVVEVNDVNRYIVGAFNTAEKKMSYIMLLQASGQAFANVGDVAVTPALSVSRVVMDPPNTTDANRRIGIGLIVGIVLAALAAACLVAAIIYSRRRLSSSNKTREGSNKSSISEVKESATCKARAGDYDDDEDDSMYNLPVEDTPSTCEDSLYTSPSKGTLDFDLQGAFRKGKQQSASVGTSDSDFAAYIASFRHKPMPTQPPVCDSESEFTADGSETYNYSAAFKNVQGSLADSHSQMTGPATNDDLTIVDEYEVLAPPGNLGIVLQSAYDGVPVVQEVKASSPLALQVSIGDRLLSVDGRDVTMVMATTVSRIIASKRNSIRRFVFARPMEI